jgi:phosphatidylserine/phosphatidylglycerophosphate/cardiolipin synthase-like enzyme
MLKRLTAALACLVVGSVLAAGPATSAQAWAPPQGSLFNNPKGNTAAKYRLERGVEAAIRHALPGSTILVATYLMDRAPSVDALLGARKRHVSVRVVLDGGISTGPARRLKRVLNRDNGNQKLRWGPDRSFAIQCAGSCRGGGKNQAMHAKFYAFSATGTARNVVMVSSANLNRGGATLGYNDMFTMSGVPKTYAMYQKVHDEMAADRVDGNPFIDLTEGRFESRVFPKRGAHKSTDPTFQDLAKVHCHGATGGAGNAGRTVIHVSMFHWGGTRGEYLARRLLNLHNEGCLVSVIYGAPSATVSRMLRDSAWRGGIDLYDSRVDRNGDGHPDLRVHTKYMVVSGNYGGDTSSWQVFTGSQNWVTQSLIGGDENTLRIDSRSAYAAYMRNWLMIRKEGARKIGR